MGLVIVVTWDTMDNGRAACTAECIRALERTVDWRNHRLIVSDNCSTDPKTRELLDFIDREWMAGKTLRHKKNLGTAGAVNEALRDREPNEPVAVLDNDAVIYTDGWLDDCLEAMRRMPVIGLVGLKRKDLTQRPDTPWSPDARDWHQQWQNSYARLERLSRDDFFKSQLVYLPPNKPGEHNLGWHLIVELTYDVMGTVHVISSDTMDDLGYYFQPTLYGFDDVLLCERVWASGRKCAFLPSIKLEHYDHSPNLSYVMWKDRESTAGWDKFVNMRKAICEGSIPVYYNPFSEEKNV